MPGYDEVLKTAIAEARANYGADRERLLELGREQCKAHAEQFPGQTATVKIGPKGVLRFTITAPRAVPLDE